MMNRLVRFIAPVLICILFSIRGLAGNEGANAGDDVGLQFEGRYMSALEDISSRFPDLNSKITNTALLSQLESIQVLVIEDELYVEAAGQKQISVAVNDPNKMLILVNRLRWQLITDPQIQMSLALHEVLSLVGLEGTGRYPISSLYYSRISVSK